jgi:hypothetical protein
MDEQTWEDWIRDASALVILPGLIVAMSSANELTVDTGGEMK